MKRLLFCLLVLLIPISFFQTIHAATNPFSIAQGTPVQAMVAGSSQGVHFIISSAAPKNTPVVVTCSFIPDDPSALQYSFNNAGCVAGVGVYNGNPVDTLVSFTIPGNITSTQKGKLIFRQTNGRGYSTTIPVSIAVKANSQRTITVTNYCTRPNGAGKSTGNDIVLGIISSATPAKNQYTSYTSCSSNADCSIFTIYSTCVGLAADGSCPGGNCYCGGGACSRDSDCVNSDSGTCQKNACTYCATDNDCMTGSSCNTIANLCYFSFPTPSKYQLNAYTFGGRADSATITLADHTAATGFTQVFNGRISPRVGCTLTNGAYSNCNVADCGTTTGSGACNFNSNAFASPYPLAEFTLIGTTPDTYDLSLESGATVAMAMYPTPGSAASPNAYGNPYICGLPGATVEVQTNSGQQNIGKSTWAFNLPSYLNSPVYQLRWVDASNGTSCNSDATCQSIDSSYYCGLTKANEIVAGPTTCGKPLGYWTFDQICTDNSSFTFKNANNDTIASCGTDYGSNTYADLLACSGAAAASCYNEGSSNAVCGGCANWQDYNIIVPTSKYIVPQCTYPNTYWVGSSKFDAPGVLPFVTWLKQACTSCYAYPYDDKSSTFTCPGNTGQSAVNYNIDLCPENKGLTPA